MMQDGKSRQAMIDALVALCEQASAVVEGRCRWIFRADGEVRRMSPDAKPERWTGLERRHHRHECPARQSRPGLCGGPLPASHGGLSRPHRWPGLRDPRCRPLPARKLRQRSSAALPGDRHGGACSNDSTKCCAVSVSTPCCPASTLNCRTSWPSKSQLRRRGIRLLLPQRGQLRRRDKDRLPALCAEAGVATPDVRRLADERFFDHCAADGWTLPAGDQEHLLRRLDRSFGAQKPASATGRSSRPGATRC
jgi:hypothetical protein